LDADESDGANADLFVDSLASIVRCVAVRWGNAFDSLISFGTRIPLRNDPDGARLVEPAPLLLGEHPRMVTRLTDAR
jgi:hypothetical protein